MKYDIFHAFESALKLYKKNPRDKGTIVFGHQPEENYAPETFLSHGFNDFVSDARVVNGVAEFQFDAKEAKDIMTNELRDFKYVLAHVDDNENVTFWSLDDCDSDVKWLALYVVASYGLLHARRFPNIKK